MFSASTQRPKWRSKTVVALLIAGALVAPTVHASADEMTEPSGPLGDAPDSATYADSAVVEQSMLQEDVDALNLMSVDETASVEATGADAYSIGNAASDIGDGLEATTDSYLKGQFVVSPCQLTIDYPHSSGHVRGTINVEAHTNCNLHVDSIQQTVQLWEKRWWGYDRIGTRGNGFVTQSRYLKTNAVAGCRSNDIIATAAGRASIGGKTFSATVQSPKMFISC